MRKEDINVFIEEMELIGDKWTPEEVENVYGSSTLEAALSDRKASVGIFLNAISKVINKD